MQLNVIISGFDMTQEVGPLIKSFYPGYETEIGFSKEVSSFLPDMPIQHIDGKISETTHDSEKGTKGCVRDDLGGDRAECLEISLCPLFTNARLATAFIKAFCTLTPDDLAIKAWDEYK